ncbi:hypothetical protein LY78DRAFT_324376 [Colletotrichum sublineola]|nr:hypothetical protein LY78DRAFT_324376 [Colletotrichum sublineola]
MQRLPLTTDARRAAHPVPIIHHARPVSIPFSPLPSSTRVRMAPSPGSGPLTRSSRPCSCASPQFPASPSEACPGVRSRQAPPTRRAFIARLPTHDHICLIVQLTCGNTCTNANNKKGHSTVDDNSNCTGRHSPPPMTRSSPQPQYGDDSPSWSFAKTRFNLDASATLKLGDPDNPPPHSMTFQTR